MAAKRHIAAHRTPLLISGAVALILGACADQTKVKECNALVEVINGGVEKIQKVATVAPDGGTPVSELRAMADTMDTLAGDCAKVELSIAELKKYSGDYQAMAKEVATAARELATAVDKVDMEQMSKAQARMEEAVKREDPVVEGINKLCRNP